ncbi:MAG: hypothetical protein IPH53_15925 [Flavobacteriales bacterium]|nr:hypothetical protein [Flavobacteriales bacterium]
MQNDRLILTANAKVVGARYDFELRFEAAMPLSIAIRCRWRHRGRMRRRRITTITARRRTVGSATGRASFMPAEPPAADAGAPERYQQICLASLNAEAHLDTVPALQQTIVAAMKARRTFHHVEQGGRHEHQLERIAVRAHRYGDYPDTVVYSSETEFLDTLRKFYDWETSKNMYPEKASDLVAWKLILRLLRM